MTENSMFIGFAEDWRLWRHFVQRAKWYVIACQRSNCKHAKQPALDKGKGGESPYYPNSGRRRC